MSIGDLGIILQTVAVHIFFFSCFCPGSKCFAEVRELSSSLLLLLLFFFFVLSIEAFLQIEFYIWASFLFLVAFQLISNVLCMQTILDYRRLSEDFYLHFCFIQNLLSHIDERQQSQKGENFNLKKNKKRTSV